MHALHCLHGVIGWCRCRCRPRPSNRAEPRSRGRGRGRGTGTGRSPATPRLAPGHASCRQAEAPPRCSGRPAGERRAAASSTSTRRERSTVEEEPARACECGALLSLFSETLPQSRAPRLSQRRAHNGLDVRLENDARRPGGPGALRWPAGPCLPVASDDETKTSEMALQLGGLLVPPGRARARLVGCRPWATRAQAAGPVVSCTGLPAASSGRQAGRQASGRWATGLFYFSLLWRMNVALSLCWFGHAFVLQLCQAWLQRMSMLSRL